MPIPLAVSVAVHAAALLWLGAVSVPVTGGEAGPMVVRLGAGGAARSQEPVVRSQETEAKERKPQGDRREAGDGKQGSGDNVVVEGTTPPADRSATSMREMGEGSSGPPAVDDAQSNRGEVPSNDVLPQSENLHAEDPEQSPGAGGEEASPAVSSGVPPANVVASLDPDGVSDAPLTLTVSSDIPAGSLLEPGALGLPRPRYPLASRRRGEEGTVVLSFRLGRDGRITGAHVYRSSGFSMLDQAALEAADGAHLAPVSRRVIYGGPEYLVAYAFRLVE